MRPFRNHESSGHQSRGAFTLIELLVVMLIIGILAALVSGLASRASQKKVKARALVLVQAVQISIDSYKDKLGFLPPDKGNKARPSLYYCLKGTSRNLNATEFQPRNGRMLTSTEINTLFGISGFLNSSPTGEPLKDFAETLEQGVVGVDDNGIQFIIMPYKGPEGEFNPLRYDASSGNRHNLTGYDLWVEVVIAGKTNIIGNW